jgi:hypothetical protein
MATNHSPKSQGHVCFKKIFDWLDNRGVRKIVNINVEDDTKFPERGNTIISPVRRFNAESFDRRKVDIYSDRISHAAPNASHVKLYNSGNREVL